MKLSVKETRAVLIVLSIARHQKNGPVSKALIAKEVPTSTDCIEQGLIPLQKRGLVVGLRGVNGGFRLAKDLSKITLYDILCAFEGDLQLVDCRGNNCKGRDKSTCVTRVVWEEASNALKTYFCKITLKSLVDKDMKLKNPNIYRYEI